MSLYCVHRRNPYFKTGDILELLEDGFQKAVVSKAGKIIDHEGLILPEENVMPFCIRMLNRGFDDPKLRRKAGKGHTGETEGYFEELSEEMKWEDAQAGLH